MIDRAPSELHSRVAAVAARWLEIVLRAINAGGAAVHFAVIENLAGATHHECVARGAYQVFAQDCKDSAKSRRTFIFRVCTEAYRGRT